MKIKFQIKTMVKTFFISDTHFNHENIIKYCNRPFQSVEEMNETMINNWNSVVDKNDIVIHLGDFAMGPKKLIPSFAERLNGQVILVKGDNDMSKSRMKKMKFAEVVDYWSENGMLCVHNPKEFLTKYKHLYYRSTKILHGHTHNKYWNAFNFIGNIINACVEIHN